MRTDDLQDRRDAPRGPGGAHRTLLTGEPGVREAGVSFAERLAEVRFDRHRIRDERLREIVETGGFRVVGQTT